MRALILNSGVGKRMGNLTSEHPKCMTVIKEEETILSRQLNLLYQCGITEVIITTGPFSKKLNNYCHLLNMPLKIIFVNNPIYESTNYIYSIYIARDYLDDDIVLMHGDLVFEVGILEDMLKQINSCMAISSTLPLPIKDFKAVIEKGLIKKIGIEFFDNAVAAQPLYKICKTDWKIWLDSIIAYCEKGKVSCYAENAFNEVADNCHIYPLDFRGRLCAEIDTIDDLEEIKKRLEKA